MFAFQTEIVFYSKTCVNDNSQKDRKLVFKTNYCLMQVKSIAECSEGSILQYFRPSLFKLPFVIKILVLSIFDSNALENATRCLIR